MAASRNHRVAVVVLAVSALCPWTVMQAAQFAGGTGDPNTPCEIAAPKQLVALGADPNFWNKHYVLMQDLDMKGVDPNAIGDNRKPFVGVFDGKDHTIVNLRVDRKDEFSVGLFGCVGENRIASPERGPSVGHIRDLHLKDVDIQGGANSGGLAGMFFGGTIKNCSVSGTIRGGGIMSGTGGLIGCLVEGQATYCSATVEVRGEAAAGAVGGLIGEMVGADVACCSSSGRVQDGSRIGGLIGVVQFWDLPVGVHETKPQETNPGSIRCCRSDCSVIDGETAGGLVGHVFGGGRIEDCYALGLVSAKGTAGGLIGERWDCCIIRCYAAGRVASGEDAGGLIGINDCPPDANTPPQCPPCQFIVENISPSGQTAEGPHWRAIFRPAVMRCFWNSETSGLTKGLGSGTDVQGGINRLTTSEMHTVAAFRNFGWDFESVWTICEGKDYPRLRWEQVECPK
jgi:hypothetical protein